MYEWGTILFDSSTLSCVFRRETQLKIRKKTFSDRSQRCIHSFSRNESTSSLVIQCTALSVSRQFDNMYHQNHRWIEVKKLNSKDCVLRSTCDVHKTGMWNELMLIRESAAITGFAMCPTWWRLVEWLKPSVYVNIKTIIGLWNNCDRDFGFNKNYCNKFCHIFGRLCSL